MGDNEAADPGRAEGRHVVASPATERPADAARERAVRVIEVRQSVFASNDRAADELRARLRARGTYLLNLMSSPGSGKTTTLARTVELLAPRLSMGVMEADIDSDVDARTMAATGVPAVQLHTGGMCHLDAAMCEQGLVELDRVVADAGAAPLDLAILENVGNLVCPAEFDTGASANVAILSVPEGDDKPLKYPLMFQVCDLVLVNKMDVAPYFDFDYDRLRENVRMRNPPRPRDSHLGQDGRGRGRLDQLALRQGHGLEGSLGWPTREAPPRRPPRPPRQRDAPAPRPAPTPLDSPRRPSRPPRARARSTAPASPSPSPTSAPSS